MAHNIALENGKHSVFTAGTAAWHKLGQNVANAQSWEEAMLHRLFLPYLAPCENLEWLLAAYSIRKGASK